jgi:hypothetical protein
MDSTSSSIFITSSLADLTPAYAMIVFSPQPHSQTPVPLPAKPAVQLRAGHGLLDAVDGLLDFLAPCLDHEQGQLLIPTID